MSNYTPTLEDYRKAATIIARHGFTDDIVSYSFSQYNHELAQHCEHFPYLEIICSDLFLWGCADSESVDWEHIDLFYNNWSKKNEFFGLAYICVLRDLEPSNLIENYTFDDLKQKYIRMPEDKLKELRTQIQWWKENLDALENQKPKSQN